MKEPITITVELSFFRMVKDMLEEQSRFFELSKEAKKSGTPAVWAKRKEALDQSKQLESLVRMHLDNILSGVGMSEDDAIRELKSQLGMFDGNGPQSHKGTKEVSNG